MAVTTDILKSYRKPRDVFAGLLGRGVSDRSNLIYLVLAMGLGFVSQLPGVQRRASLPAPELEAAIRAEAADVRPIEGLDVPANMVDAKFQALMSAELMVWFFILPLVFYGLAALVRLGLSVIGWKINGEAARLALFWALLVAVPLKLLHGLVYGVLGPGPALTAVGAIWFGILIWNYTVNLSEARKAGLS